METSSATTVRRWSSPAPHRAWERRRRSSPTVRNVAGGFQGARDTGRLPAAWADMITEA